LTASQPATAGFSAARDAHASAVRSEAHPIGRSVQREQCNPGASCDTIRETDTSLEATMSSSPERLIADKQRPFTGAEYLESLRDGREVYIYGERVKDVTVHPAFRNGARSVAKLYDALHDMIEAEKIKRLMELGIIEIAPLAFMRGRTLNSAFVILDEAQNTSHGQMKMFLTRMGLGSKAIVTGDITQIDLEDRNKSGLLRVKKIIGGVKGIAFVELSEKDVVRHRLVLDIIKAYDKFESRKKGD